MAAASSAKQKLNVCWIRRDLRLVDHAALAAATNNGPSVCLFIFDDHLLAKIQNKKSHHLQFMYESLQALDQELQKHGSRLYTRRGNPFEELKHFCQTHNVENLFYNRDYEPYAQNRDTMVEKKLQSVGVTTHSFQDHVIFEPKQVVKDDGSPYRVFTPYKKSWLKHFKDDLLKPHHPDLSKLVSIKEKTLSDFSLASLGFLTVDLGDFLPGSIGCHKQMKKFNVEGYAQKRDRPDLPGTSRISPHLRFGTESIRRLCRFAIRENSQGHQTWLNELIWREFYQMILFYFPIVCERAFIEKYADIKWPGDKKLLQAWQDGLTGYPIVDAGMRQLKTTGWMHNRVRMIVASFLTKDLLVNWQDGEDWFREHLIDYELASNNGGWQWAASTGCDPQPYFRIFNPTLQSEKFDPDGLYIKKFVPELGNYPSEYIHEPELTPIDLQKKFGCIVGKDYPTPIVNHKMQKTKALKLFNP